MRACLCGRAGGRRRRFEDGVGARTLSRLRWSGAEMDDQWTRPGRVPARHPCPCQAACRNETLGGVLLGALPQAGCICSFHFYMPWFS